jgi:hypothetical protein
MSRQELAEAVNAHLFFTNGIHAAVDAHYVGRLERGKRRWPSDPYRAAFRAVLGAATDAELGFTCTGRNTFAVSDPVLSVLAATRWGPICEFCKRPAWANTSVVGLLQ